MRDYKLSTKEITELPVPVPGTIFKWDSTGTFLEMAVLTDGVVFLNEDNMISNSISQGVNQKSLVAYVEGLGGVSVARYAGDIHAASSGVNRFHVGLTPPIIIDCRMKPWYPHILEVDDATKRKVDQKIASILPARWIP